MRTAYIVALLVAWGQAWGQDVVIAPPASAPVPAILPTFPELHLAPSPHPVRQAEGYRGLWYSPGKVGPLIGYPYGGGLGTYPSHHGPLACYAAAVKKTFFVYAGTNAPLENPPAEQPYQASVGCFDHQAGTVSRPTVLFEAPAGTHGAPAMTIDQDGRLWVFAAALGTPVKPTIYRSVRPYDISEFEKMGEDEFFSPQPWHIPGQGFVFIHGREVAGRLCVCSSTSPDGLTWSAPTILAVTGSAQSWISGRFRGKVGVALSCRQDNAGVVEHSGLYYLETRDFGRTWTGLPNSKLSIPLDRPDNPALVREYGGNWLFLPKDLNFDPMGGPLVLYLLRNVKQPVPRRDTRIWSTAKWVGREWEATGVLTSDHDYDSGCIAVERLTWWLIAPTQPGSQPLASGGDLVNWQTETYGRSWYPQPLTSAGPKNHNYVRRPVDADPGFFAFWADGNARRPSSSCLYFMNKDGDVYRLPATMTADAARPEVAWPAASRPAPTGPDTQPESQPAASTRPAAAK